MIRAWQSLRAGVIWVGSLLLELVAMPLMLVLGPLAFLAATVAKWWKEK